MEHITEPWQIIFLCVAGLIFGLLMWLWIRAGIAPDAEPEDFGPAELIQRGWSALIHWRPNMSSYAGEYGNQKSNDDPAFSPATTTPQNSNNALQSDATYSKGLLDGQALALAIAVKAGKWGETEGIKEVFGISPSSTNPRYIAARAALKSELARLESPALFRQDDGTAAPATRPVTGRRTHA